MNPSVKNESQIASAAGDSDPPAAGNRYLPASEDPEIFRKHQPDLMLPALFSDIISDRVFCLFCAGLTVFSPFIIFSSTIPVSSLCLILCSDPLFYPYVLSSSSSVPILFFIHMFSHPLPRLLAPLLPRLLRRPLPRPPLLRRLPLRHHRHRRILPLFSFSGTGKPRRQQG